MTRSSTRYQARIRGVALGSLVAALSVTGVLATSLLAIDAAGAQTAHSTKTVVIATSSSAKLGTYLVSGGRTLYILNKKACAGQCLTYWPPVELSSASSSARAGAGVAASKLGKVKDAAGKWQVTFAGKPLFWFYHDVAAGQVKGNNVKDSWGIWSIVVTVKPASTGKPPVTTTTSPGTGGVSF